VLRISPLLTECRAFGSRVGGYGFEGWIRLRMPNSFPRSSGRSGPRLRIEYFPCFPFAILDNPAFVQVSPRKLFSSSTKLRFFSSNECFPPVGLVACPGPSSHSSHTSVRFMSGYFPSPLRCGFLLRHSWTDFIAQTTSSVVFVFRSSCGLFRPMCHYHRFPSVPDRLYPATAAAVLFEVNWYDDLDPVFLCPLISQVFPF